jgi:hypothetical protein
LQRDLPGKIRSLALLRRYATIKSFIVITISAPDSREAPESDTTSPAKAIASSKAGDDATARQQPYRQDPPTCQEQFVERQRSSGSDYFPTRLVLFLGGRCAACSASHDSLTDRLMKVVGRLVYTAFAISLMPCARALEPRCDSFSRSVSSCVSERVSRSIKSSRAAATAHISSSSLIIRRGYPDFGCFEPEKP